MNRIMTEQYPMFELYRRVRDQVMDLLSDDDLSFQPGGDNLTLGHLCREIGEVEQAYIDSFKTFRQDFSYRNEEPGLEKSVVKLSAWYEELDRELRATLEGLSDDDIQDRLIDRGENFKIPPHIQLEIYKEALLIFYGKVSVYLKAMRKAPPEQFQDWIG
jgi:uncharacterized damage-inducible protein DinB